MTSHIHGKARVESPLDYLVAANGNLQVRALLVFDAAGHPIAENPGPLVIVTLDDDPFDISLHRIAHHDAIPLDRPSNKTNSRAVLLDFDLTKVAQEQRCRADAVTKFFQALLSSVRRECLRAQTLAHLRFGIWRPRKQEARHVRRHRLA
jgi:hypothetical protein